MSPKPHVFCSQCDYYSESHDGCFYPDAWTPSSPFKEPGDCRKLNSDYYCSWYEPVKVYPSVRPGRLWWGKVKKIIDKLLLK